MIHIDTSDGIATLRMEHGKANAVDIELFTDLGRALDEAASARAVVLTGTGSIFSAGVNLFKVLEGGNDYVAAFLPALVGGIVRVFTHPRPVIAAVNGHALAGGCVLAAACDLRVMADGNGTIGVTEMLVGVPFPDAALETMRFLLAPSALQSLVYTGRTLAPAEARACGLVDEVVAPEQVVARAQALAAQLAAIPSESFALTKKQLRAEATHRMELARWDGAAAVLWKSPEVRATVKGYVESIIKKR